MHDLLENLAPLPPTHLEFAPGAVLLRGFALPFEDAVTSALHSVISLAPLRHMITPGGFRMSVSMTNCGSLGWITDRHGYRYATSDPETGKDWPEMPAIFRQLAHSAADAAGYAVFTPDACLINRYAPGAKMSLHQDKDEKALSEPVVSLSLGIPATFLFGGMERKDKTLRLTLSHGDVAVWGGPARLCFHGIAPLKEATHPRIGRFRYNLTFRKAVENSLNR